MSRVSTLKPTLSQINTSKVSAPTEQRLRGRPAARMRERILMRDDYLCQQCLREGMVTIADEVDHIVPLHRGGSNAEENQEGICGECHAAKGAREERERRGF